MTDQEKDPVVNASLSKPLFISSALLLLSLGWGLYDEVYGTRPWKGYQARFEKVYSRFLRETQPLEAGSEQKIKASAEYKDLDRQVQAAEKAVMPQVAEIDRKVNLELVPRSLALNDPFQEVRGHVGALTYQIEISKSESSKDSMRKEIEELRKEVHTVKLPTADGSTEKLPMNFAKLVDLLKPATELRAKRDKYLTDHISDVSADTLNGLKNKMATFEVGIRQIHVKDVDLVDRCESCHMGIQEPVTLTKAAMGGEEVFISHPDRDLLKIHDPEKFGCTPCHGGNGVALTSVEKAHGYNEHWLWPLHAKENLEAGCQQCHTQEIVTEMAPTLDAGREIFRLRGCMACHRYEGFDRDPDELSAVNQDIRDRKSVV